MPGIRPTSKKEVLEALLVEVAAKVFVFCRWSAPAAPLLCFSAQLLMLLTKVSLLPGLDWRRRRSSWEDEKALLESSELIPCMLQLFWRVLIHIPAFDPHTCFRFSYYNFPFSSQVSISKSFFFEKFIQVVQFACWFRVLRILRVTYLCTHS